MGGPRRSADALEHDRRLAGGLEEVLVVGDEPDFASFYLPSPDRTNAAHCFGWAFFSPAFTSSGFAGA